jgi:hypothetical protein
MRVFSARRLFIDSASSKSIALTYIEDCQIWGLPVPDEAKKDAEQ